MSNEAKELRELAKQIGVLTCASRISSIAYPAVSALCDYLTLRAKVMEMEAENSRLQQLVRDMVLASDEVCVHTAAPARQTPWE